MEHYLQLVRYNAEHIATRLPDEVDTEDLVSAGVFGLKDAIDAYDPNRGAKFETFCTLRIRGAILDELRALDWVPRLVRNRSHRLREAQAGLEAELGRPPTDQEVARRLNLPPAEFEKLRADGSSVAVVPLSRRCSNPNGERERCDGDLLPDQSSRDPVKEAYKRDIRDLITRGLSRAERLILILYYYEEMTMKEIGATLDLSESRVSQMHSAILARLKHQLQARQSELVA
jgi:RNA polymerase sigma factor for flagellar operon FliA